MDDHDITRHDYGGKIETDCKKMVQGMVEMFDELGELALTRIYAELYRLNNNFDIGDIPQTDLDHFKLTWMLGLGELMFFSMADQPKLEDIKSAFYDELDYSAEERNAKPFLLQAKNTLPKIIRENSDFMERGIFNSTMSNREEDTPRNRGLGPQMATIITEVSFAGNRVLSPAFEKIRDTVEAEFNNAYGHCAIACNAFLVV
ncbi:MAG: hypothetical protein CMM74_06675 [Rhodospirillaceae bacterium]|nr:hypothetical protein [Rhodospirillaceae bacterium]